MSRPSLREFWHRFLTMAIFSVTVCAGFFAFAPPLGAAVAPNGQQGKCGPYYLWYQIGPDSYHYAGDYVDLCEITFDVTDMYNDFDLVYFTGKWAQLDKNRDGISDQYFSFFPTATPTPTSKSRKIEPHPRPTPEATPSSQPPSRNPTALTWKPEAGWVRINLRNCWGNAFNEKCGYAAIRIQPKPGVRTGNVKIPVTITKKCPPYGDFCNETTTIPHSFSECFTSPMPDFIVQKQVTPAIATGSSDYYGNTNAEFKYTIIVQYAGEGQGDTVLTDIVTDGTNGGVLELSELKIVGCPSYASCSIVSASDEKIQIAFTSFHRDNMVTITYSLRGNSHEIPENEISYFTNTATLSTGGSAQVTVGLRGMGDFPHRRPERPRQ